MKTPHTAAVKAITSISAIGPSKSGNALITVKFEKGNARVFYMKPNGQLHEPTSNHTPKKLSDPKRADGERRFALDKWDGATEEVLAIGSDLFKKAYSLVDTFDGPVAMPKVTAPAAAPKAAAPATPDAQVSKFNNRYNKTAPSKKNAEVPNNLGAHIKDENIFAKLRAAFSK
ncbi:MAG: hypothetical protein V4478_00280 [Patescibacteria group bacterium]